MTGKILGINSEITLPCIDKGWHGKDISEEGDRSVKGPIDLIQTLTLLNCVVI